MNGAPSKPAPHTPWPRRRRELAAVAAFCAANVVVPLAFVELYPFSRAPMFCDAPRLCCDYSVLAPDGTALPNADFGLQRNYWGNPVDVSARRPPETIDRFGDVADGAAVTAQVQRCLARFPRLAYVEVVQEVVGPVDEQHVGVTRAKRWRVLNPHHPGTAGE